MGQGHLLFSLLSEWDMVTFVLTVVRMGQSHLFSLLSGKWSSYVLTVVSVGQGHLLFSLLSEWEMVILCSRCCLSGTRSPPVLTVCLNGKWSPHVLTVV